MLLAMPDILSKYPDAEVYVGGNRILRDGSFTERMKESAYGRYLRKLLADYGLTDKVHFLGKLNAEEMKAIFLSAHTFVCCSSIENSPNSLGEAMLLGMPCVTALVGGVGSIFHAGQDGISYAGFDETRPGEEELSNIAGNLANAVIEMWDNEEKCREYCENARRHAGRTHNREENYRRLLEIYDAIVRK